MVKPDQDAQRLRIKKYSNRRFYDTTRSRHVTLDEMYDLICEGVELEIADSKTGDDITNIVLTQIILENDPPKLDLFPASILHQIIRTQRQFLGSVVEEFFRQWLAANRESQARWLDFLRGMFTVPSSPPINPLDWTRQWWPALTPQSASTAKYGAPPDTPPNRDPEPPKNEAAALSTLQEQIESMSRRIDELMRKQRERDAT